MDQIPSTVMGGRVFNPLLEISGGNGKTLLANENQSIKMKARCSPASLPLPLALQRF
jgi:hypothetical protein